MHVGIMFKYKQMLCEIYIHGCIGHETCLQCLQCYYYMCTKDECTLPTNASFCILSNDPVQILSQFSF